MAVYMKTNLLNTHGTGRRRPGSSNACVMSEKLAARPTKGLDEIVGASVIQQGVASRSLRVHEHRISLTDDSVSSDE